VGKRTRNTCRNLFKKINNRIKSPSPDSKLEMYSDGNNDYTEIIKEFYPLACVDYGQLIKVRKGGRVVDKIKRVVFGEPNPDNIETTDVENMNSIMRERIGRLEIQNAILKKGRDYAMQLNFSNSIGTSWIHSQTEVRLEWKKGSQIVYGVGTIFYRFIMRHKVGQCPSAALSLNVAHN